MITGNKELENLLAGLQGELTAIIQNPEVMKGITAYIFNMRTLHGIPPDISIKALLTVGAKYESELITIAKEIVKTKNDS